MPDITSLVTTAVDYLFYAAWIAVGLSVVASVYFFATQDAKRGREFLFFSIAAAVTITAGWAVITSIGKVPNLSIPGAQYIQLFAYAGIAISIAAAAINFAAGRPERAFSYLGAAVVILVAVNIGAAGSVVTSSVKNYQLSLSVSPTFGSPPLTVNATVAGNATGSGTLSWGDGSSTSFSSLPFSASHTYTSSGAYTVLAQVKAGNTTVSAGQAVLVRQSGGNWLVGIIQAFEGIPLLGQMTKVLFGLSNLVFVWLTQMPTYDSGPFSTPLQNLYSFVAYYAIGFVGLFVLGDVLWIFFWEGAEDVWEKIIRIAKEVIVVLIVIYAAPYLYSIFAGIVNQLASYLVNSGDPSVFYYSAITLSLLGALVGPFDTEIGVFGGILLFSLLLMIVFAFVRYLAIGALLITTPILAVFWLFPPLRRVVDFIAEIILGFAVGGLIVAAILAFLGNIAFQIPSGSASLIIEEGFLSFILILASPFLLILVPNIIAFSGIMGHYASPFRIAERTAGFMSLGGGGGGPGGGGPGGGSGGSGGGGVAGGAAAAAQVARGSYTQVVPPSSGGTTGAVAEAAGGQTGGTGQGGGGEAVPFAYASAGGGGSPESPLAKFERPSEVAVKLKSMLKTSLQTFENIMASEFGVKPIKLYSRAVKGGYQLLKGMKRGLSR